MKLWNRKPQEEKPPIRLEFCDEKRKPLGAIYMSDIKTDVVLGDSISLAGFKIRYADGTKYVAIEYDWLIHEEANNGT